MLDRHGVAGLIDWGCAAFTKNAVVAAGISGTFRYASDEVLEAAINESMRTPKPKDDLRSLVRVILARRACKPFARRLSGSKSVLARQARCESVP
mmetsp:Transcript_13631/g.20755  ORF Transcript_13631/g.20755 Transcript_13631/m.20755 type:complete len:95 (+) Transcript_13631:813-1097(+)